MWIDAHTHLEMLEKDTEQTLKAAGEAGVTHMVTIGCHPNDFSKVCRIASDHYPQVAATLGVHPHEAKFYTQEVENTIRTEAQKPFLIGVGEIGLDFFYNHSDQATQRDVFRKQMTLAYELGLPVQIHSRDAEDDTLAEINYWKGKVTGMLHCFTGTEKLASGALDAGFYISLSGVITFKNADDLREVVKKIPVNRILTETDAPFLSPVPMRGKKNEPAYVAHTALKICELKGIKPDELSRATRENIKRLFPKWNF